MIVRLHNTLMLRLRIAIAKGALVIGLPTGFARWLVPELSK
jgi:hypothetical protein